MTEARKLALVTGASSGIGLELAKQFVLHDFDLVVCSEEAEIFQAADALGASGANVTPVQADLRSFDGVETLYSTATAAGGPVDAAALNAGVGVGGPFVETDLAAEMDIIDLNIKSTVHLAKRLLIDMAARNEGRVLITSSIASMTPGSFQSVYAGSKAFLQSSLRSCRGPPTPASSPGPRWTTPESRRAVRTTRPVLLSRVSMP
jgi:uncharacterized protein